MANPARLCSPFGKRVQGIESARLYPNKGQTYADRCSLDIRKKINGKEMVKKEEEGRMSNEACLVLSSGERNRKACSRAPGSPCVLRVACSITYLCLLASLRSFHASRSTYIIDFPTDGKIK